MFRETLNPRHENVPIRWLVLIILFLIVPVKEVVAKCRAAYGLAKRSF